jgi:hypothetical protein
MIGKKVNHPNPPLLRKWQILSIWHHVRTLFWHTYFTRHWHTVFRMFPCLRLGIWFSLSVFFLLLMWAV